MLYTSGNVIVINDNIIRKSLIGGIIKQIEGPISVCPHVIQQDPDCV